MSITRDRTTASAGPPARAAGRPAAAFAGAQAGPVRLARHLPTTRRRRLLRELCRNATWVTQARTTPTVQAWMDSHGR